jgi:hypothetical protein
VTRDRVRQLKDEISSAEAAVAKNGRALTAAEAALALGRAEALIANGAEIDLAPYAADHEATKSDLIPTTPAPALTPVPAPAGE